MRSAILVSKKKMSASEGWRETSVTAQNAEFYSGPGNQAGKMAEGVPREEVKGNCGHTLGLLVPSSHYICINTCVHIVKCFLDTFSLFLLYDDKDPLPG